MSKLGKKLITAAGSITVHKMGINDLSETLAWLHQEERDTGEGFYCNRNPIRQSYDSGEAFVARVNGVCVGLLTENHHGPEIVTVHRNYRRLGIGRALMNHLIARARQRGSDGLDTQCVTYAGEQLCRAMGFLPVDGHVMQQNYFLPLKGTYLMSRNTIKIVDLVCEVGNWNEAIKCNTETLHHVAANLGWVAEIHDENRRWGLIRDRKLAKLKAKVAALTEAEKALIVRRYQPDKLKAELTELGVEANW